MDRFETLRSQDYYYLDKTEFIRKLLDWYGAVNLFTRPRRFGKSLNMSMLKAFFEIGTDLSLFEGLAISRDRSLCEEYMGRFPVIFLSLKGVEGTSFSDAQDMMSMVIAGHSVKKKLIGNLTYEELEEDRDHLWSVLYLTGYLTAEKNSRASDDGKISLVIPNREIREIFVSKIQKWFSESTAVSGSADLYEDIWACNAQEFQEKIREILLDTISYFDYHENYYHAFMAGLLMNRCVRVKSNYESGTGRSDLVIEDDRGRRAVVIETKYSARYDDMEADCEKALGQIQDRQYVWPYLKRKYCVIIYGIAFSGKDCQVKGRILKPETR